MMQNWVSDNGQTHKYLRFHLKETDFASELVLSDGVAGPLNWFSFFSSELQPSF